MTRFEDVFRTDKPVVGMVHLGALPGAPLHDHSEGVDGLIESARADLAVLCSAGFDAVMFGNENDRPYELEVDSASTATMAYVIGALRREITVPFGVNVLWDPMASIALAAATFTALPSCGKSSPGSTPPTWEAGFRMPAGPCATGIGWAGRIS